GGQNRGVDDRIFREMIRRWEFASVRTVGQGLVVAELARYDGPAHREPVRFDLALDFGWIETFEIRCRLKSRGLNEQEDDDVEDDQGECRPGERSGFEIVAKW